MQQQYKRVGGSYVIKVADFGFSIKLQNTKGDQPWNALASFKGGTPHTLAPEVRSPYALFVFSFTVCLSLSVCVATLLRCTQSQSFVSSQVISRKQFNQKIDVYSFGMVLWGIVTCKPLYPNHKYVLSLSLSLSL